jgi:RNA polymerase I specific initiation factor
MEPFSQQQWSHLDKGYSPFLFASPDGKRPSTARKVHIRRLRDILHLSIQRGDLPLARRAFGLLARCEEIEWVEIWKIGLIVVLAGRSPPGDITVTARARHIEFLRAMMLQHPEEVRACVLLPPPFAFSFSFGRGSGSGISSAVSAPSPPPTMTPKLTVPRCSANRSYRSWCYPWRWLDGSAKPSMN